jgi:hypothetical protein
MRQILRMAWQQHDRLTRLMWSGGWTIPLAALALLLSIPFWQAAIINAERTAMQEIDYEDSTLCAKFGFAAGSDKYAACMLDLLDLRHGHERLMADAMLP